MRNSPAYCEIIEPGKTTVEFDSCLCGHCGRIMLLRAGMNTVPQMVVVRADGSNYLRDAGFCRSCWQHVCPACDGKECKPHLKQVEEEEAAARRLLASQ